MADNHVALGLLCRLAEYSLEHFAKEEQAMLVRKYPGRFAHIEEHKRFIEWLSIQVASFERGAADIVTVCYELLDNWRRTHVVILDNDLDKFILCNTVMITEGRSSGCNATIERTGQQSLI